MLPFLSPDYRSQHLDLAAGGQAQEAVHHLVHRLPPDRLVAMRTMGRTYPGKKQAQIVIDFSHRPYRGTGIVGSRFLVYGDSRREPFNVIYIRFVHLAQKLAGIGGKRLHITPLAFTVNSVKSQTGLART